MSQQSESDPIGGPVAKHLIDGFMRISGDCVLDSWYGFTVNDAKVNLLALRPMTRTTKEIMQTGLIQAGGNAQNGVRLAFESDSGRHDASLNAFRDHASRAGRLLSTQRNQSALGTLCPDLEWAVVSTDRTAKPEGWLLAVHLLALSDLSGPLASMHEERWFDFDSGFWMNRIDGQPPRGSDYERAQRGFAPWPGADPNPKPARLVRVSVIENIALASAIALPILLAKTQPTAEELREARLKRMAEHKVKIDPETIERIQAGYHAAMNFDARFQEGIARVNANIQGLSSNRRDMQVQNPPRDGADTPERFERAEWFEAEFGIIAETLRDWCRRGHIRRREQPGGKYKWAYSVDDVLRYRADLKSEPD